MWPRTLKINLTYYTILLMLSSASQACPICSSDSQINHYSTSDDNCSKEPTIGHRPDNPPTLKYARHSWPLFGGVNGWGEISTADWKMIFRMWTRRHYFHFSQEDSQRTDKLIIFLLHRWKEGCRIRTKLSDMDNVLILSIN